MVNYKTFLILPIFKNNKFSQNDIFDQKNFISRSSETRSLVSALNASIVFEKIIVELDGPQHIDTQIPNRKSPEEQQERDIYKMDQAINNEKHVIRILQHDVWNDTNDWKEKLIQSITELKDVTEPTIRFIGDCEVYKEYTIE